MGSSAPSLPRQLTCCAVREIGDVITTLTTGNPEEQETTLNTYFLRNAGLVHPFCRVPSFSKGAIPLAPNVDSLWVILAIYRWYRTLSPKIDISVDSAVFDQRTGKLYVAVRQTFVLWFVPLYRARVRLTTVLQLTQRASWDAAETVAARNPITEGREPAALAGPGQERARYLIASQEDLYQANDCIQFLLPGLGPLLWTAWQLWAALMCLVGSLVLLPLYLVLNKGTNKAKAK